MAGQPLLELYTKTFVWIALFMLFCFCQIMRMYHELHGTFGFGWLERFSECGPPLSQPLLSGATHQPKTRPIPIFALPSSKKTTHLEEKHLFCSCTTSLLKTPIAMNTLAHLIFVISFTSAGILNPNILHPKMTKTPKNYNKLPKKVQNMQFCAFNLENFAPDRICLHRHRLWCL